MTTLYSRCLVNENTVVDKMLSMVEAFFFFANTTGRSNKSPITMAGAIPEASMVNILLISVELYLFINSMAMAFIKLGSIW